VATCAGVRVRGLRAVLAAGQGFPRYMPLLQVHALEASGRGRALHRAVPDATEGSCALLEVARLRRAFGETLRFQLDLALTAALAAFLREITANDDGELAWAAPASAGGGG
jgi:hypothetical protein